MAELTTSRAKYLLSLVFQTHLEWTKTASNGSERTKRFTRFKLRSHYERYG